MKNVERVQYRLLLKRKEKFKNAIICGMQLIKRQYLTFQPTRNSFCSIESTILKCFSRAFSLARHKIRTSSLRASSIAFKASGDVSMTSTKALRSESEASRRQPQREQSVKDAFVKSKTYFSDSFSFNAEEVEDGEEEAEEPFLKANTTNPEHGRPTFGQEASAQPHLMLSILLSRSESGNELRRESLEMTREEWSSSSGEGEGRHHEQLQLKKYWERRFSLRTQVGTNDST